uniref:Flagellar motor switch protein FliM n=1 Tax=Buchnera aphidicola (Cinara pseudotsugae) TaxID=2518978 RepID=A0A451DEX4_9GAMM
MSRQSKFLYKKSTVQTLHNKYFINFVLKKQKSFFKELFFNFCFLLKKKFNKWFYCNVNIDFYASSVEYNHACLNKMYLQCIGKKFFLNVNSNECLILVSRVFSSMFIGNIFGNYNMRVDMKCTNLKLTKNEMNVLDVLFEKIFFICNTTFLKKISSSIINTGKYITQDYLLSSKFISSAYICFTFLIYVNNHQNRLKIYLPKYIVGDLQK